MPPSLHTLGTLLRRWLHGTTSTPDTGSQPTAGCSGLSVPPTGELAVLALAVGNYHALRSLHGQVRMDQTLDDIARVIQLHLGPLERQQHDNEGIFLVICPGRSAGSAHLLANRICCAVAGQIMLGSAHRPVRMSAGLAQGPVEASQILFTQARAALQAARRCASGHRLGHHPPTD
jgi:GGDEF domain-containing protein